MESFDIDTFLDEFRSDRPIIHAVVRRKPRSKLSVNLSIKKHNGEETICSLCLEDIKKDDEINELSCSHIFHSRKCLDNRGIADWIAENKTCPYCRAKIDISNLKK